MSAPGAQSLPATYYDGVTPVASAASLVIDGDTSVVAADAAGGDRAYATAALIVSPRVGRAPRFVALPDGGQVECADDPLLDRLPQEVPSEGAIAWLERRSWVAVLCLVAIGASLLAAYVWGLPAAAESVAARVPIETEAAVGREALAWLDRQLFRPARYFEERENEIRDGFARLHTGLARDAHYRLELRGSRLLGPNALALPGGIVVLTEEMSAWAVTTEEVMAILAHEIGHVEARHSLRLALQGSATAVLVAAITSDAASLSVAVAGLPMILVRSSYSREFEREADDFAFALLRSRGISPEAFATLMERLSRDRPRGTGFGYLASHPLTSERIRRAREAAK